MKKLIFVVLLGILSSTAMQGQRMLPKQKAVEVSAGMLGKDMSDYYLNMTLTVNGRNGNYWIWGAEYNHQSTFYKDIKIPIETYMAELGYSFQLLGNAKKSITLNGGITGFIGYETINRNDNMLFDGAKILDKEGFIYGASGRLSLETYLSDRFVLLLQGRVRTVFGTDLKQFRPSTGLGLRFNF